MPRSSNLDNVAPDDPIAPPTIIPTASSVPGPSTAPAPGPLPLSTTPSTTPWSDRVYTIFGHTKSPFSSSLIFPHVFHFTEQNDDEKILVALRPHWFTNVHWVIISFILFLIPSFFQFVPLMNTLQLNYQFVIVLSWYLVAVAYTFENFLGWYFNVYIVTDHRVIDIDFINLLTKKFAEADLSKIQDVTSEVSGFSQTMLNYGSVLIQTAAEINEITFQKIPNPEKVVKILQELTEANEIKGGGV